MISPKLSSGCVMPLQIHMQNANNQAPHLPEFEGNPPLRSEHLNPASPPEVAIGTVCQEQKQINRKCIKVQN